MVFMLGMDNYVFKKHNKEKIAKKQIMGNNPTPWTRRAYQGVDKVLVVRVLIG